ncbi:MAG: S8 family peptidase [bacterium]|nr:S8 family serine peptidase [Rhodocyclaceae bacterium]
MVNATTLDAPRKALFLAVASAVFGMATPAGAQPVAPWLAQMKVTPAILSAGQWGTGQVLGVVDTGIAAGNSVFAAGQVSRALSGCAAVTFRCSNGANDDNNHGTAVAAIAAANARMPFAVNYRGYSTAAGSVIGMAPNANIVAQKVLNASGSGYSTDVANGLVRAANAGAGVINLSLTFGNTPELVAAINYAAGKGAFIVWAGGNSAQNLLGGASTRGLTAAAVSRLVFVGSVNASGTVSSFSNRPGSGSLVDTGAKATSYAARWVTAPGENILAPAAKSGNGAYAAWSGTSMSAPLVSGSLLLLQGAWPILRTNGTAANLLLATATDLGVAGVDSTYGNGLVNLATAFSPYGTLTVTQANGRAVPVSSLTGSMISSGALGNLSAVQSRLANYTALDGYQRNFSVNLSGLIRTPSASAQLNALPVSPNAGVRRMALDGGELSMLAPAAPDRLSLLGVFGQDPDAVRPSRAAYALLEDRSGAVLAFGYGTALPVQYSYVRALHGSEDAAIAAGEMATNLSSFSQGGSIVAAGMPLGGGVRVAFAYSGSAGLAQSPLESAAMPLAQKATAVGAGLAWRVHERLQIGVSTQSLGERNGLLGSSYSESSAVGLGSARQSIELGVSALISLSARESIFIEASQSTTRSGQAGDASLLTGTSDIRAQAFGARYSISELLRPADRISFSFRQPLRVTAGSASLAVTSIDPVTGVASTGIEQIDLAPTGRQRDYRVGYDAPLSRTSRLGLQFTLSQDALNIAGNDKRSVGLMWTSAF